MKIKILFLKVILILLIGGVFVPDWIGGKMESEKEKKVVCNVSNEITSDLWEKLSKKKIFFGHQSVGKNIIDGIKDLMKEHPGIKLNIVETNTINAESGGIFAHGYIGKNEKPKVKIDDFINIVENSIGKNADIALMKLCYVDITANSDVQKIFDDYRYSITMLQKKFPNLYIVHVTSPLTLVQSGYRAWIKKLIGRTLGGVPENIARNKFNKLIRDQYLGKAPVFDLAEVESTRPDGSHTVFEVEGVTYYAMTPEYTPDRGHLNEVGRQKAACELLMQLANLN